MAKKKTNGQIKAAAKAAGLTAAAMASHATSTVAPVDSETARATPKRIKSKNLEEQSHVSSCNDPECIGCDVGPIEVELVQLGTNIGDESETAHEMTAIDIYHSALEELSKSQLSDQDVDRSTHDSIVTKLFEQALEQFKVQDEQLTSDRTTVGNTADDSPAVSAASPSKTSSVPVKRKITDPTAMYISPVQALARLQHAACLLDFGQFIGFDVYLREAHKLLSECKNLWESTCPSPEGWCLLGRTSVAILQTVYYPSNPRDAESDDDSNNETDGVRSAKPPVSKDEQMLVDCALECFDKAVSKMTEQKETCAQSTNVYRQSGKALLNLALSQRHVNKDVGTGKDILKTALGYIKQYFQSYVTPDTDADPVHLDMQRVHATCLYHLASIMQHSDKAGVLKKALEHAKKSLGEAAILWSSLEEEDDDAALQAFDEASVALQRAYELDPENEDLEHQLMDLGLLLEEDLEDQGESDNEHKDQE
ncbi:hypothetical protein BSLG_001278 [Batrachochytrium salamandrivorans]|nr:hypothetical protein BSLG_001278 [Batrachochytrium salamandrivorans]